MPLDAIVLLGWMERDAALAYLCEDCIFDPPLTKSQAEETWAVYRDRVESLGERDVRAPERLPLTCQEQQAADRFLDSFRSHGPAPNILNVIKVDGRRLVAWQNYIILDRARLYMEHATAATWCARNTLVLPKQQGPRLQIPRSERNCIDVDLPHSEFFFSFLPQGGFQIQENAQHVDVTAYQDRLLLFAGYHRSYARIASANPQRMDRSLLVVLTTDGNLMVSPDSPNQGLRAMLCGLRPPLFGDFFDDRLFMPVRLRTKRYELRIRAAVVGINCEPRFTDSLQPIANTPTDYLRKVSLLGLS